MIKIDISKIPGNTRMLMDAIIGLLNDYPNVKEKLGPLGPDENLGRAIQTLKQAMDKIELLGSLTDEDTDEKIKPLIDALLPIMKSNPNIEHTYNYTHAYEHILIIFNKMLHLLNSPERLDDFTQNRPGYPMNALLLFVQAVCYSSYMMFDDPYDNNSFMVVYNRTIEHTMPYLNKISIRDWNRWQRRFMYQMGLLSHPDPHQDSDGQDFYEAVKYGNQLEIEHFSKNGLSIPFSIAVKKDARGWTLIHFAAYHDIPVISLLINLGIDPNEITHDSRSSAVHIAAQRESREVMAKFLRVSHLSLAKVDLYGHTPLYYAIKNRFDWAVYQLLDRGVPLSIKDIHAPDERGYTLFHYAASYGYLRIIDQLIEQLADPNLQATASNQTPLHLAAINAHSHVIKAMLQGSVSLKLESRDSFGKTAYDHYMTLSFRDRDPQVVTLFNRAMANQGLELKPAFS